MSVGKKMLWGGLGWALAGPIGAIIGYSLAGMSGQASGTYGSAYQSRAYPQTQPGDFIVSLLVLFSAGRTGNEQRSDIRSELCLYNNNYY